MSNVYVVETHDGREFIHTCIRSAIEKAISMIMEGEPTNTIEEYMEMMDKNGYIHIRTSEYFTFYISKKEVEEPKNDELQKGHEVAKGMAAIKAYGKDEESEMDNISGVAINTIRDLIGNEELKIKVDNGYELECLVDLLKSSGLEYEGGYSFIKVYGVWTGFNIYGFLYDEHRFNKTEAIEINLNNGECIPTENISSTEILRNMISIAKWREQTGMGEMIESYGSKKTHITYIKESIGKKVESGVNGMFRNAGSSMRVAFVENKFVPWKEVN